jgi:transcriptional regulator with XRE-family HTH domain
MNKDAVNEWIVGQMNAQNMSIRELGRQSGVAHSGISKILSGQREGTFDVYIKIARVFDAVPEMLQVAGVLASEKDIGDDVSLWEIVKMVKALDLEERQELERYLDYLSQRRGTEAKPG